MKQEQKVELTKTIENTLKKEAVTGVFTVYAEKFKELELNIETRKALAKKLDAKEQEALNWKTVQDVFSFIDTSTLAKEHPSQAVSVLRIVASIVAAACAVVNPVVSIVAGVICGLPEKDAAILIEWLGKPTPEHIVYKIAEHNSKDKK